MLRNQSNNGWVAHSFHHLVHQTITMKFTTGILYFLYVTLFLMNSLKCLLSGMDYCYQRFS